MKVKVCGMRDPQNVRQVAALGPDYMGFIFHKASPRFVSELDGTRALADFPHVKKVGVLVDMDMNAALSLVEAHGLDMLQLHGSESPGYCSALAGFVPVAKAFRVGPGFDFAVTAAYDAPCELFVFDARGSAPGGNGIQFDWDMLKNYSGGTPFLLSGGIGPEDLGAVSAFSHPQCIGVDLNSGFESAPAHKEPSLLADFFEGLRRKNSV